MNPALAASVLLAFGATEDGGGPPAAAQVVLTRDYQAGERVAYTMTITLTEPSRVKTSQATSSAVVKGTADAGFYEDTAWTQLAIDGRALELSAAGRRFTQQVSSDPAFRVGEHLPKIGLADARLTGYITELLNIYVDLQLAARTLRKAGDQVYVPYGRPSSWKNPAAGVLSGEDCIDFDLTLLQANALTQTATVLVRHVPPKASCLSWAAHWMQEPVVAGRPNNWTQVVKRADGGYLADTGLETFDVEIQLDHGRVLSMKDHNPVQVSERLCSDEALTSCSAAERYELLREVAAHAVPAP